MEPPQQRHDTNEKTSKAGLWRPARAAAGDVCAARVRTRAPAHQRLAVLPFSRGAPEAVALSKFLGERSRDSRNDTPAADRPAITPAMEFPMSSRATSAPSPSFAGSRSPPRAPTQVGRTSQWGRPL